MSKQKTKPRPTKTCLTIYGRDGCPFCHKAVVLADKYCIPFKYYDVHEYPNYKSFLKGKAAEHKTVPVIFWNGKFIGGSDDFESKINDGSISSLKCSG